MSAGGKHDAIRSHLLELIGDLPDGQPIPAERQLALELGVARMTLRRAVDGLVAEGRLVRVHRKGTFVARRKLSYPHELTSFSADMSGKGMRPSSRTLEFERIAAGPRLARRLQVSPDEEVIRAVRLRLADEVPMAIERLHVPRALVPDLTGTDLERNSFYDLLSRRYGITLQSAQRVIEATVTSADEAEILTVPLHSAAFFFERTSRDTEGRIVEYVRSVYRGDRFRIVGEVSAMPTEPPESEMATQLLATEGA
jgi:GntR family transcriptional regulator